MKVLNLEDILSAQTRSHEPRPRPYLAMYSSVFGGIVTDPRLMMIPIDDHMVHRGDGVFEAIRCHDGAIYDADAHLQRLSRSAEGISLKLRHSLAEIKSLMIEVIQTSQVRSGTLRLYASRGPGDFTPNPYSTTGSEIYVVYTAVAPYRDELYREGATLGLSAHAAKPRPYCNIKSCNYLNNVLMKMEAVDRNLDFMVSMCSDGQITESSTENVALVTRDLELVAPPFENMLRGTTLERVIELVSQNPAAVGLTGATQRPLYRKDFEDALCALIIGTTMEVMPVKSFEKTTYAKPQDLPWLNKLMQLLKEDIQKNPARRTLVEF